MNLKILRYLDKNCKNYLVIKVKINENALRKIIRAQILKEFQGVEINTSNLRGIQDKCEDALDLPGGSDKDKVIGAAVDATYGIPAPICALASMMIAGGNDDGRASRYLSKGSSSAGRKAGSRSSESVIVVFEKINSNLKSNNTYFIKRYLKDSDDDSLKADIAETEKKLRLLEDLEGSANTPDEVATQIVQEVFPGISGGHNLRPIETAESKDQISHMVWEAYTIMRTHALRQNDRYVTNNKQLYRNIF